MDRVDMLLFAGAGYIAVITLVRLMAARREDVIRQLREKLDERRTAEADAAQEDEPREVA